VLQNLKNFSLNGKILKNLHRSLYCFRLRRILHYSCDGIEIEPAAGKNRMIFDEEYIEFKLKDSGAKGKHVIKLNKEEPLSIHSPFYLEGDFDVNIAKQQNNCFVPVMTYYSFSLEMSQYAAVSLSKRKTELNTDCSWAEQGQIFYSGIATYEFDFSIPEHFKHPVLKFGRVASSLSLTINGANLGTKIFPPYEYDLDGFNGKCICKVRVENTLGNMLDGYGTPSGLLSIPELLDTKPSTIQEYVN